VYGKFWLWVLAAYEVCRTLTDHEDVLSERQNLEVAQRKENLAKLRMPFAKQQLRFRKAMVRSELSVYGIDTGSRDLLYEVQKRVFSTRELIGNLLV